MPYKINISDRNTLSTNVMNHMNPISFKMTVDRLKYPNVDYTVQTLALPDISLPPAPIQSPLRRFGMPGDKIEYSPLSLTFLIDEDMINYKEIHDWILEQITEVDDTRKNRKTRDLTLSIMTSHNNVTRQLQFIDAYPISLSSLPFDVTITDVQYLTAEVTFEYTYYKFL